MIAVGWSNAACFLIRDFSHALWISQLLPEDVKIFVAKTRGFLGSTHRHTSRPCNHAKLEKKAVTCMDSHNVCCIWIPSYWPLLGKPLMWIVPLAIGFLQAGLIFGGGIIHEHPRSLWRPVSRHARTSHGRRGSCLLTVIHWYHYTINRFYSWFLDRWFLL